MVSVGQSIPNSHAHDRLQHHSLLWLEQPCYVVWLGLLWVCPGTYRFLFKFRMPGRSWAPRGSLRRKWLEGESEAYCEAADQGTLKDFYSDLLRRYFEQFHWSIPDDADANTTPIIDLANYGNDDPELQEHLKHRAEIYNKKRDVCVFDFFDGTTLIKSSFRKKQLKNWYSNNVAAHRNHNSASSSTPLAKRDMPSTGSLDASSASRQKTLKKPPNINRKSHCTEPQVYMKLYYESRLKQEVDTAFEAARAEDPKAKRIDVLARVAHERYAEESDEVKAEVKKAVDTMRASDGIANAKAELEDSDSPDVASLQQCVQLPLHIPAFVYTTLRRIDKIPVFLEQTLQQLHKMTGFRFTVYCGGHDAEGELVMKRCAAKSIAF